MMTAHCNTLSLDDDMMMTAQIVHAIHCHWVVQVISKTRHKRSVNMTTAHCNTLEKLSTHKRFGSILYPIHMHAHAHQHTYVQEFAHIHTHTHTHTRTHLVLVVQRQRALHDAADICFGSHAHIPHATASIFCGRRTFLARTRGRGRGGFGLLR